MLTASFSRQNLLLLSFIIAGGNEWQKLNDVIRYRQSVTVLLLSAPQIDG